MTTRRLAVGALVVGLIVLVAFVYLWLDTHKADEPIAPPDEATQTPVVEPLAPEELKSPPSDDGQTEATQAEPPQTPQRDTQEAPKGPNGTLDPVAEAWAVVNRIEENLHEWGTFYPEAEKLIEQLLPVWKTVMPDYDHGDMEDAIELLEKLRLYPDPRAAEVFVEYTIEGPGGRRTVEAAVALGPASVPFLMPHFKRDYPYNDSAAEVFVPIWQAHRELLDGVAKHLVIPEIERALAEKDRAFLPEKLKQLKSALGE